MRVRYYDRCLRLDNIYQITIWRSRSAPTTDRLLIEVIIMNNYLLITHGFDEFQIQEIVRKMADVRDAKLDPRLDRTVTRALLHYAIEYMTDSDSNKIGNIGDLYTMYLALAERLKGTFRHNRSKKLKKGVKTNFNDDKQMKLDLWNGAENEEI